MVKNSSSAVANGAFVVTAEKSGSSSDLPPFPSSPINLVINVGPSGMTIGANNGVPNTISDVNVIDGGIVNIQSGGTIIGITVDNGKVNVSSGGAVISGIINHNNGTITDSGGISSDIIVNGGTINVSAGGLNIGGTINSNGSIADYAGGTSSDIVVNGGRVDINSGGLNLGGTVQNGIAGGTFNVWDGGINSGATATDSARIYVASGGTDKGVILQDGGHAFIGEGGIDSDGTVRAGGWDEIGEHATVHGGTVMQNGTMNINNGGTVIDSVLVGSGATVTLFPNAGGTLNLETDDNKSVTVEGIDAGGGTVTVDTVFSNFNGDDKWNGSGWVGPTDGIHLAGVQGSDVTGITFADDGKEVPYPDDRGEPSDEAVIHLKNGGEIILHIPDAAKIGGHIAVNPDGSITYEADGCFLAGTRILTPDGYKKVENLSTGDEIITIDPLSGERTARKLVWTGIRRASVNLDSNMELGDDEKGWPVCIKKGAFDPLVQAGMIPAFVHDFTGNTPPSSDRLPLKDLSVTSEHCFLFRDIKTGENKFIPIRMLVNGNSIYYDHSVPSYLYYHIETEAHSVILAEGVLSESYLDTGDRSNFRHLLVLPSEDNGVFLGMGTTEGFSNKALQKEENLIRRELGWKRAAAKLDTSRSFAETLWVCLTRKEVNFSGSSPQKKCACLSDDLMTGIYLSCGQKQIKPYQKCGKQLLFMLPNTILRSAAGLDGEAENPKIYLCSPSARPCNVEGPFLDDRRRLGVLVGRIRLAPFDETLEFHLSADAEKLAGWNNIEPLPMRWTKGKALLPFHKEKEKLSHLLSREEISWTQRVILAVEIIENMGRKAPAEKVALLS